MTKQERIAEYVSAELSRGHPKTQEDIPQKQLRNSCETENSPGRRKPTRG